jgi:hypothetical protein
MEGSPAKTHFSFIHAFIFTLLADKYAYFLEEREVGLKLGLNSRDFCFCDNAVSSEPLTHGRDFCELLNFG